MKNIPKFRKNKEIETLKQPKAIFNRTSPPKFEFHKWLEKVPEFNVEDSDQIAERTASTELYFGEGEDR
jgi:hypothetical protein